MSVPTAMIPANLPFGPYSQDTVFIGCQRMDKTLNSFIFLYFVIYKFLTNSLNILLNLSLNDQDQKENH